MRDGSDLFPRHVQDEQPNIKKYIPTLNLNDIYFNTSYHSIVYEHEGTTVVLPSKIRKVSSKQDDDDTLGLGLISLPNMAGMILVDKTDLTIVNYNKWMIENLLGHEDSLAGLPIDHIIPGFSRYLTVIREARFLNMSALGLVIPEHMFRKVAAMTPVATPVGSSDDIKQEYSEALRSSFPAIPTSKSGIRAVERYSRFAKSAGIICLNKYRQEITIDVQLRVLSPSYFGLWITYCRQQQDVHGGMDIPSQLKLFQKKSRSRAPTTSSIEPFEIISNRTDDDSLKLTESIALTVDTSLSSTEDEEKTSTNVSVIATSSDSSSTGQVPYPYSMQISEVGARRREKSLEEFSVLQNMGEGAYGKVLLAQYKTEPQLIVVVKCVIKERILVDTWTRDRKLGTVPNEIKVMATLNSFPHENIVRLLDFFENEEYYHIEMERHGNPGIDLFDLIDYKSSMDESECKSIFKQVVSAIHHLHYHGIVHRDIKDENIVIDERDGKVKLIDFGSSAFSSQGPFDVFVGTIDYAAPEVLAGQLYNGRPQDIWALGILLYTIIYKENPYYNVDEIMDGELRIPYITSMPCIDLIKLLLDRDIRKRPTIEEVVKHEWLNN